MYIVKNVLHGYLQLQRQITIYSIKINDKIYIHVEELYA